jgi:hypothetical protein
MNQSKERLKVSTNLTELFAGIADAIRYVSNEEQPISAADFPEKIKNLPVIGTPTIEFTTISESSSSKQVTLTEEQAKASLIILGDETKVWVLNPVDKSEILLYLTYSSNWTLYYPPNTPVYVELSDSNVLKLYQDSSGSKSYQTIVSGSSANKTGWISWF